MIRLEPMTEERIPELARLEAVCFVEPWSERSFGYELETPLSLWLLAIGSGDRILGYAGSHRVMDEADIMNIAVSPEARRQGVGRTLLEALLEALTKNGARSVTLEVRAGNTPARRLYKTMGFVKAGCRPGYYERPREDALILRRTLGEETV